MTDFVRSFTRLKREIVISRAFVGYLDGNSISLLSQFFAISLGRILKTSSFLELIFILVPNALYCISFCFSL